MQDEGEVGQAKAHAWRLARGLLGRKQGSESNF